MNLADWHSSGWLYSHEPSPQEIADLLAMADRDLRDSQAEGLSADWRFNIAYSAVLQAATAALAAAGYRAVRESHHYRVVQSLSLTVGLSDATIRGIDAFRKKRNVLGYERTGVVSDQEVRELFDAARHLRRDVEIWIRRTQPHLLLG